jgi:hypothetical protein
VSNLFVNLLGTGDRVCDLVFQEDMEVTTQAKNLLPYGAFRHPERRGRLGVAALYPLGGEVHLEVFEPEYIASP